MVVLQHCKPQAHREAATLTLRFSVVITIISNLVVTGDPEQVSILIQSTPHTDERSSYTYPKENILSTGPDPSSSILIYTTFKLSLSY